MVHFYCVNEVGGHHGNGDMYYWHFGVTKSRDYRLRSPAYRDCIFWEDLGERINAERFEQTCACYLPWVFAEHCLSWNRLPTWEHHTFLHWHVLCTNMLCGNGLINLYGTGFLKFHENYPKSIDGLGLARTLGILLAEWREGRLKHISSMSFREHGKGRRLLIESIRQDPVVARSIEQGRSLLERTMEEASSCTRRDDYREPAIFSFSKENMSSFSVETATDNALNLTQDPPPFYGHVSQCLRDVDPDDERVRLMRGMMEMNRSQVERSWASLPSRPDRVDG